MNRDFNEFNISILSDFYEYTMAQGYFNENLNNKITYFDIFYRENPDGASYAIFSGLEHLTQILNSMRFNDEDIEYFKSLNTFDDKFLNFLKNFKFECDIWSVPEGSVIFPYEPIMTVRGPAVQAQLIETIALLIINHESLIATKSNRIKRAAKGRAVMEFGARRAQGIDASVYGAKASYIAGIDGTSNVLTGKLFNIPVLGTMAHSWVQMFDTELEAFKAFAKSFPNNCVLLVDTYNTLQSGIPNAIKTFDEILKPMGIRPKGIRLDSGDLAYLSKQARKMLDNAGYEDAQIVVSNSLDEYTIRDLLHQGAQIDSFGIGERLITSKTHPVFGGVYKLVAIEENGKIIHNLDSYLEMEEMLTQARSPQRETEEEEFKAEIRIKEPAKVTQQPKEANQNAYLSALKENAANRKTTFKNMSYQFSSQNNYRIEDLENTPAYMRKNVDISSTTMTPSVSRSSISLDSNNIAQIRENNSYLHDNVD